MFRNQCYPQYVVTHHHTESTNVDALALLLKPLMMLASRKFTYETQIWSTA